MRRAQDGEYEVDTGLALGRLAEDVQTVADLRVFDLAKPTVHVQDELVELFVARAVVETEVLMHLSGLHERPDLGADRGQLRRIHRRDVRVFVEQLLQFGDVTV